MRAVASCVIAGVLAALALVAEAQPSDKERAKDLYRSAEAAMKEARYTDAIRDYGAAYEITKDPAFFYKIGSANERAGKCDVALIYYRRYLKEGKPNEDFAKVTASRIEACEASARVSPTPPDPKPDPGGAVTTDPKPKPKPDPGGAATTEPKPKPDPGGAATTKPVPVAVTTEPRPKPESKVKPPAPEPESGPDGAAPKPGEGGATPPPAELGRHRGPWLLVGGSIALLTAGAVLAYSANAAERDVEDLYVGLNGTPPPYNATTKKLYGDAIAEGQRYQTLSIVSFSLACAMAIGAAVWFVLDKDEKVQVAPAVAPGGAGVSAAIRF